MNKNEALLVKKSRINITWVTIFIAAVYRLSFVIWLVIEGFVHTNRYTYWNYVGQTLFYVLLLMAYSMDEAYLLKWLSIYIFPIVFGSVFFVYFYIIIVLQLDNGWLFISATNLGGGSASVGTVHTFDHVIHTFITLDLLFVLNSGYGTDLRLCVWEFLHIHKTWKHGYMFLYCLITPLIPIGIYSLFFNPLKLYPTDFFPGLPIIIGAVIYFFIILWMYWFLTTQDYGHLSKDRKKLKQLSSLPPPSSSSSLPLRKLKN
jgi:hypothetical protein